MARELKATSIRLLPEEVDAVEKFRGELEKREMLRISTNAAILRLVRIGLRETGRRAGK